MATYAIGQMAELQENLDALTDAQLSPTMREIRRRLDHETVAAGTVTMGIAAAR